jgi:dihydrofolate reductase
MTMTTVFAQMAVSLDGFVAGPDDGPDNGLGTGGEQLHEWMFPTNSWREPHGRGKGRTGPDDDVVAETVARSGATVLGRRMFDNGEVPWGDDPPFHQPVFVVTTRPRPALPKRGGTTYHFVTEGIERALELAREAAGDRDVEVAGGADVVQQFLLAGLLDELELHVAPVMLGGGVRMFSRPGIEAVRLAPSRVVASPAVTHIRYDVVR